MADGQFGQRPDVVVAGEIDGVIQSRVVFEAADPIPRHYVAVRVRVTDELRTNSPKAVHDGYVYLELYQGGVGGPGGDDRTPYYSLADWSNGLPAGTPVLLFLDEIDEVLPVEFRVDVGKDVPPDAEVMWLHHPQGLILEDDRGRLVGGAEDIDPGWSDGESIDELVDRLRAHMRGR
jgi:hypothetical protein